MEFPNRRCLRRFARDSHGPPGSGEILAAERLLPKMGRLGRFVPPNQEVHHGTDDDDQNSADDNQTKRHTALPRGDVTRAHI